MSKLINLESSFSIDNILMMQCSMERINTVLFDETLVNRATEVNVDVNMIDEFNSAVVETVTYTQTNKETKDVEVKLKVTMLGIFKLLHKNELSLNDFSYVNAPALMFPYIREHMSNMSLKAGIGNIILAPVDFTKFKK